MTTQKLILKLPLQVVGELDEVIKTYKISNPNRLAHFLAQCGHESGNFKLTLENLNYSEEGLLKVFPKYFDKNTAKSYAKRPEMIANMVYGGRMGNGDKNSGDGYKFRGRGFIQLTGKTNYKSYGDYIGVDLITNPNLVATKYPLSSAAWFFEKRKLWAICDEGISIETIKKVTKIINGGYNGLEDRISKTNIFTNLLT
jgi:putative chitinase